MRSFLIPLLFPTAMTTAATGAPARTTKSPAPLQVTSAAFAEGASIPAEYTCDGANVSPPLAWSKVPADTRSVAILVDDPDAPGGTFTHWLVTGIPPTTTSLGRDATLPRGAIAATNDMGRGGYAGPCPPSGRHRYRFHVYALDVVPASGLRRAAFLAQITGHVLAAGQLLGTYERRARR